MNTEQINRRIELEFLKNNPSYYFVSTGHSGNSNRIFYTLRKTFINTIYYDGIAKPYVDSVHIQNLSTDYNKAISKAEKVTSNQKLRAISEKSMNTWGEGSTSDRRESIRKKLEWKRRSDEISRKYLSQYEELDWSQVVPSTDERVEFTGTVLGTKYQDSEFGGCLKMIFEDERGFKIYGSVPNKLLQEELTGLRLKFYATVKASSKDKSFGYFKRPTKIIKLISI